MVTDGLEITHRSSVTPDQIDHLGHMNVRYYGENAMAGTRAVLAGAGVDPDARLLLEDMHTNHLAEQMEGASLHVRSGVLGVGPDAVWLYHELRNTDSDVLAATFHHHVRIVDAGHRHLPIPDEVRAAVGERIVTVPDHGRPRTLVLDRRPDAWDPGIDSITEHARAIRLPRTIRPDECDDDGFFDESQWGELMWGGEMPEGMDQWMNLEGDNGERLGFAILESRASVYRLPRAGDRTQTFTATIGMANKTMHRIHWVYDIEQGHMCTSHEVVDICLDLDARRAVVIPDKVRIAARFVADDALFRYR